MAKKRADLRGVAQWIELTCERQGWSRYRLARELKINDSRMSRLYHGREGMPEHLAAQLAPLVGESELVIWAECKATGAAKPEVREFWERVARETPRATRIMSPLPLAA